MDRYVRLHHGGNVVRTCDDSVKFENMEEENLLFSQFPSFMELIDRVRDKFRWNEYDVEVVVEGRIDVGSSKGPRIKRLARISCQSEWETYKEVVMSSEVRALDLVVWKEVRDDGHVPFDLNQSPLEELDPDMTLPAQDSVESLEGHFGAEVAENGIMEDMHQVASEVPGPIQKMDYVVADGDEVPYVGVVGVPRELELHDDLWRISNEIENLKSQLANKEKEKEKELWYLQENKKVRVELDRTAKDMECPRKQNEKLKAKSKGLHNNASFQGTPAGITDGRSVPFKVPCAASESDTEYGDLETSDVAGFGHDEAVAAPRRRPSESVQIGEPAATQKVAQSSWVRQHWNTLTDEQKQAAIKLHDAGNSSIPVYVCDIKFHGIVYCSVEFSVTYLRAKSRERLPLKAFAANKLTTPVDINFFMNKKNIGFLSRGWSHFAVENGIKVGDICAFQFSDKAWSVTVQVIKTAETEDVGETIEEDTGMAGAHASGARTGGSPAGAPVVKRPRQKKPPVSRRDSEAMQCATGEHAGTENRKGGRASKKRKAD